MKDPPWPTHAPREVSLASLGMQPAFKGALLRRQSIIWSKSDIDELSAAAHIPTMNDLARDPKQVGNLIRRARKRQALNQKLLGEKAGLRQETISLIETGNAATKLETLLAVLSALNLELRIAPRSQGGLGLESDY